MHNSQRCDAALQIWLAGLNMNIPVNTTECFRLTDFWATMYVLPLIGKWRKQKGKNMNTTERA
jgi:hypothetical protein